MQTEEPNHGGNSGSPTVLVRAIGVHAAVFLLIILVVGCGGQSSTTDEAKNEAEKAKQQTTTESGPNKQEVAIEEGSLRDLVQEQVGDFELQEVEEIPPDSREKERGFVGFLKARYTRSGGPPLHHRLTTTRSPEAADNGREQFKKEILSEGGRVVDERPVEASGRRVGTLTMIRGESVKGASTIVLWNNGNLFALAGFEPGDDVDALESFYESVPY